MPRLRLLLRRGEAILSREGSAAPEKRRHSLNPRLQVGPSVALAGFPPGGAANHPACSGSTASWHSHEGLPSPLI